jgi:hypothetical protein
VMNADCLSHTHHLKSALQMFAAKQWLCACQGFNMDDRK